MLISYRQIKSADDDATPIICRFSLDIKGSRGMSAESATMTMDCESCTQIIITQSRTRLDALERMRRGNTAALF